MAALTRIFGIQNLALAEDAVQDTFCRAFEIWKFRGQPLNPSAWLMAAAKNRAIDILRRERTARTFAPEVQRWIESEWTLAPAVQEAFEPNAIADDPLRLMFSCCHPRLTEDVQAALILHLLCGFSAGEVAAAFVSRRAAIQKRISRGKKVLAASQKLFDLTGATDFAKRLPAVQRALYLLFNEGYHSASPNEAVRTDLCREAIRLTRILSEHPWGALPVTFALSALMHLHAARLPARVDANGELSLLVDQDRSQWDGDLIAEGRRLLNVSAAGHEVTPYHVEAGIAAMHASALRTEDTDWQAIVFLYDTLLKLQPTPVVALNRAIALAQRDGPAKGLSAIREISGIEHLVDYPFYPAAVAELKRRSGDHLAARQHYKRALLLARNPVERRFLEKRLSSCDDLVV